MSTANTILNVNNIEVIYNHVILVLKGVSLTVPEGGIVALLGGNGAGKTTTLRAVSNLLHGERGEVTKGTIEYRNERIEASTPADLVKRGVIQAATEILTRAWDRQQNAGELLSFSEGRLSDVHAEQAELSVRPIAFVIADVRRKENSKRPEDQAPAIVTGFRDLDERVRMRPGWLIILAARPSHGKSTLAMNIAAEVCKQQAGDTLFISCEMGDDEILAKMVSAESNVLLNDIVDGTMNAKDREYFMAASNRVSEWDLYLDVPRRRKASDIIALARRHQRRTGKLALIVVDYLGLLEPEASDTRGFTTRTDELAKMTRILKQGAQELKVPIMCLCQLSRTNEKTGERPKLHHLRDSGAIEQDADAVWFVHRPHFNDEAERVKENTRSRDTFAEIIVAKQRIGGTGMVRLDWHGQVSRFADQRERGPGEAPLFENQEEDF